MARLCIFSPFSAPQMRQQANLTVTTERSVIAAASERQRARLGLRPWRTIGHVGGVAPLTGTELGLGRMSLGDKEPEHCAGWAADNDAAVDRFEQQRYL